MIPLYEHASTNNGVETGKCIGVSMVILLTLTLPFNYFTFIYTIDVVASLSFICVFNVLTHPVGRSSRWLLLLL